LSALNQLLERRPAHHIQWGLDRTLAMLRSLEDPHLGIDAVHVAGTNGKGSTAALLESVLRAGGRVTGLYTSPHLSEFAERIRIDGEPADRRLLERCAEDVLVLAEREDASFFESATVLAFLAFRRARCDAMVVEVGLGGRLDATNVLRPRVSAITSLDLDHADYLGDTVELVAAEKAGILKAGVPTVLGRMTPGPLAVVRDRARELRAPLDVYGTDFEAREVSTALDGTRFSYSSSGWADGVRVNIPLIGPQQARNAAIAIRCLEKWDTGTTRTGLVEGLAAVRWAGRFEVFEASRGCWVLDIAHNPEATRNLAALIEQLPLPRPLVLLLSILGDKPWREMLGPLLDVVSASVFTIAPSSPGPRRWRLDDALQAVQAAVVEVEPDFGRAMARARELAGDGTVLVTGSAHTVGDARSMLFDEWNGRELDEI
jgi:dihydrofolate synthase / folylpolyglutamate synthase